MQEQLPLRPAEFVKIRDGFIAFLKQPAGTPIEHVVPQAVIDAMVMAAQRGRNRRRMLDTACSASVLVSAIGAVLAIVIEPMIIGIVILLIGGAAFIGAFNRRKIRSELEIDELVTEPNEALQRNLRALDDFRNVIANGDMTCEERLPDGSVKPVTTQTLRAFRADHGALLILSRDQGIWQCIPRRPIPLSALWVRLGGRVAPAFVTSRGLLDTSDRHLFDQRVEWLLSHADQTNHRARSFREAIQIIVALRRPDLDGLTFERKKELLCAEGFGESRMEKIHAGIYPAFNNFLRTLPMHEFP
jgi:hypothetical protein